MPLPTASPSTLSPTMPRALLTASLALLLTACSASPVRVRITQLDANQTPRPLAGARLRAITLDAGTIPLPINSHTLAEMLTRQQSVAITDAQGVARLKLLRDRAQLLELEGPLTFTDEPIPTARWVLAPDATLTPAADNLGLAAHIVD